MSFISKKLPENITQSLLSRIQGQIIEDIEMGSWYDLLLNFKLL
jgi:hypothetical protein